MVSQKESEDLSNGLSGGFRRYLNELNEYPVVSQKDSEDLWFCILFFVVSSQIPLVEVVAPIATATRAQRCGLAHKIVCIP